MNDSYLETVKREEVVDSLAVDKLSLLAQHPKRIDYLIGCFVAMSENKALSLAARVNEQDYDSKVSSVTSDFQVTFGSDIKITLSNTISFCNS